MDPEFISAVENDLGITQPCYVAIRRLSPNTVIRLFQCIFTFQIEVSKLL